MVAFFLMFCIFVYTFTFPSALTRQIAFVSFAIVFLFDRIYYLVMVLNDTATDMLLKEVGCDLDCYSEWTGWETRTI